MTAMSTEVITYTFRCRRCQTEFQYTMDHDGALPLRDIQCPAEGCSWSPMDSVGEPPPYPPKRRRRRTPTTPL